MSSIIEQIITRGFKNPNLAKSGPSSSADYWKTREYWVLPYLARAYYGFFAVGGGSTIIPNIAISSSTGSTTNPAIATTDFVTQTRRAQYASATATNAHAGQYTTLAGYRVSSTSNIGGFLAHYRWANVTTVTSGAANRAFVGVSNLTTQTGTTFGTNPYFGFGFDSTDDPTVNNYFYLVSSDASVKVHNALSSMARTANTMFDAYIWCYPGIAKMYYWVWDLTNDVEAVPVTSTTATLPTTQALYSHIRLNTGTSSAQAVLAVSKHAIWTPW
jgi:hypothetical protein